MELQTYNAIKGLDFGSGPINVDFGPFITNTGCADLDITALTIDDAPFGSTIPSFSIRDSQTDDLMMKAQRAAERMSSNQFAVKGNAIRTINENADPRTDLNRNETINRAASAVPAWYNAMVSPTVGTTVPAGDTINLIINVQNELVQRGPNIAYLQIGSNDPDFFLNDVAALPDMRVTLVGGCLEDTTYLNFGSGGANYQVVYNTGRLGYEHETMETCTRLTSMVRSPPTTVDRTSTVFRRCVWP